MAASRRRGRGEGSIQKRPDGKWRATISLGIGPDGKRRRKDIYGATKAEVQRKLRAVQSANDAGKLPTTTRTTVAEYLEFWLENISKVKASTKQRYRQLVTRYVNPVVGKTRLQQLTPIHIDSVISSADKSGLGKTTQRNLFGVLRKSLNDAVKRDLIGGNPCLKCDAPQQAKSQQNIWTAQEAQQFLEHTKDHRLFALFALAAYTGMRQGESLALQWSDIDWNRNKITISRTLTDVGGQAVVGDDAKTDAGSRTISVPTCVMEALDKHRARMMMDSHPTSGSALVFVSHRGTVIRRRNLLRDTFKPSCKAAGVPVLTWHQMRHSAATMMLESGVPIGNVSKQLGHASSVVTAMVYSHVTDAGMDRVADAMSTLLNSQTQLAAT
jgi:integrase